LSVRTWIKRREHPAARLIWAVAEEARKYSFPCIPAIHKPLSAARLAGLHVWREIRRILWWTPLFQSRLVRPAPGIYLMSSVPQALGALDIEFGRDGAISGMTTLTGRAASAQTPRLIVGDACDIGWQVTIAVGSRVVLGRNVKIAGRCCLAGYPGHPQDPARRAANLPDDEAQVGDIVPEDDVRLAIAVTVLAGARIGAGSIVTPGSVAMRDIPPGVVATGNPARIAGPVAVDRAAA
jgi:acetyltransferase-like isoleucine patch superfamily enzyme